jgi:hypothetical protein
MLEVSQACRVSRMTSSLQYELLKLLPAGRKIDFDNLSIYQKVAYRSSQPAMLAQVHQANLRICKTLEVFYHQLSGAL